MIARYLTERGAARYRDELRVKWPKRSFIVAIYPNTFNWTVAVVDGLGRIVAYAEKRPRRFA